MSAGYLLDLGDTNNVAEDAQLVKDYFSLPNEMNIVKTTTTSRNTNSFGPSMAYITDYFSSLSFASF